jgi:hypothetical protein
MITFAIILLGVGLVSSVIVFWMEFSITNDRLRFLEEKLYKLEKDAVKVTFTGEPKSPAQSNIKPVKIKKRNPKTVGEWEDEIDLGGHE